MTDSIEKIGNSLIHYGKKNDRIYIMKYFDSDREILEKKIESLLKKYNFSKLFAKIPNKYSHYFQNKKFEIEAKIPNFFNGKEDVVFFSKFLDSNRKLLNSKANLDKILEIANTKQTMTNFDLSNSSYTIRQASLKDAFAMSELYKQVFSTYPFPIFDPNYIISTMKDNIIYYGIWDNDQLVSLASAEMDMKSQNSEMTDFATLPNYRGKNFASILLHNLELKMQKLGIKTLYTIARAKSFGMNITFKKNNYIFSGLLKNNTNISGSIESMNVWYKHL